MGTAVKRTQEKLWLGGLLWWSLLLQLVYGGNFFLSFCLLSCLFISNKSHVLYDKRLFIYLKHKNVFQPPLSFLSFDKCSQVFCLVKHPTTTTTPCLERVKLPMHISINEGSNVVSEWRDSLRAWCTGRLDSGCNGGCSSRNRTVLPAAVEELSGCDSSTLSWHHGVRQQDPR